MERPAFALPAAYSENVLTLMICSPTILFVYWDFSEGRRRALVESGGVYLRLSGVDRPAGSDQAGEAPLYELPASGEEQSSYFAVVPGGTYRCEIGVYAVNCLFLPVLVSNTVTAPGMKGIPLFENAALAEVAVSKEGEQETAPVEPPGYYSGALVMIKEKVNAKPGGLPFRFL